MKRIATTALCLALCLAALAAQGKAAAPNTVPGTLGKPGTFPVSKDKIQLTFFTQQFQLVEDFSTNLLTKELEDMTNIHVNWETVPIQGLKEKRNLILASGKYPDVFFGADLTMEEQMLYGSQGILVPLNDLIEKWAPETKKLFATIPWYKKAVTAPDGNIYALPQIDECFHCTYGQKMWINKTWLDKLGLKMPTTTEEFRNVLRAFRDRDPNGNGKKDEVPLTGAINIWHSELPDFLMCAFIYCDGDKDTTYRVTVTNGKVESIADKPEFREGLRYIASLYKEGLIDPAAFTQNRQQLRQLGENPDAEVIGAATSGWFGYFTSLNNVRHKDYTAVPPLKGPKGVRLTGYYPFGFYPGAFAITKTNKYPEASMRMIDWFYSKEGTLRSEVGRKGTEWEVPAKGEKSIDGRQAAFRRLKSVAGDMQNFCYVSLGPLGKTKDLRLSEIAAPDPMSATGLETRLYQETLKYVGCEPKEVFPPVFMKTEQINEMSQLKSPLNDYIKESMARFITGDLDIEKDWDKYVKGLKNLGIDKYVALCQAAYDASAFKKK
jgi:putative aldouronate transport system substrate-binding protein